MIGIIGAMDEELAILLELMEVERDVVKADMNFKIGTIDNKNIVVVRCGIGKVNAAICTQILVDDFKVDKVINVGIAGGIGKDVCPGDVVVGTSLVQHDVDATNFGYELGQIPRLDTLEFKCDDNLVKLAKKACEGHLEHKCFTGKIATGDQFIASVDKVRWIKETFGAIACEMEGGSIAHVCYLNSVPFVVIRSISDNADNGAHLDYDKFQDIAIKNSTNILKTMISEM